METVAVVMPKGGRGRRSAETEAKYQQDLAAFYASIIEIDSHVLISVSVPENGAISWKMQGRSRKASLIA